MLTRLAPKAARVVWGLLCEGFAAGDGGKLSTRQAWATAQSLCHSLAIKLKLMRGCAALT